MLLLISSIPEDGRRAAYAEAQAKAKAEEEAREAAEAAKKQEEEVKRLSKKEAWASSLAEEAQEKDEAAGPSIEELFTKAKDFGSGFSWDKLSVQLSTTVQKSQEEEKGKEKPKAQIATVRGQAKARSLPSLKAIVKPINSLKPKEQPKKKGKQTEPAEVRKVFGGLFSQETIYVDDD